MAGEIIRPSALPARADPVASEVVPSDNGTVVSGVTWAAGVAAGRPLANQAEAEAGANAEKAMTPLTTKQAIVAQGDVRFASAAQGALADSATQPGDLATVATTGDYDDLTNLPDIPPGLTDGDKGDVTVSDGGTDWGLNAVVDRSKLTATFSRTVGISVFEHGATGDNSSDDGAAFSAAQAAAVMVGSKLVVVPAGAYVIDTPISLAAGVTWLFLGAALRTTQASGTILSADTVDDWALLGNLTLIGTRASTVATPTTDTQRGLSVEDCDRYLVQGVTAKNILGRGFDLFGSTAGSSTLRGDRGQFTDCAAYYCTYGRYLAAGAGAEYTTWSNWLASGNYVGDFIAAGNCATVGGSVVDNATGVQLGSGSNHGHGIYSGTQINHNTTANLDVLSGVTQGFTFSGCHFYEGPLLLDDCAGIVLDGGKLDVSAITVTGTVGAGSLGWNYVRNMLCPGGYGPPTISGSGASRLAIQNCDGPGRPVGRVSEGVIEAASYRAKSSNQALTSATLTTLTFSTTTLNAGAAFTPGTGLFVVPVDQGGVYEISWNLIFNGGAISDTASYVTLEVDDAGDGVFAGLALSLGAVFGSGKIQFSSNAASSLAGGTQMRFRASITATSPYFGDNAWYSLVHFKKVG